MTVDIYLNMAIVSVRNKLFISCNICIFYILKRS